MPHKRSDHAFVLTRNGAPMTKGVFRYADGWFEWYRAGMLSRIRLLPEPGEETVIHGPEGTEVYPWADFPQWLIYFDQADRVFGGREIPPEEILPGLDMPPLTERSPLRDNPLYPVWRLGRLIPPEVRHALQPYAYGTFSCLAILWALGDAWARFLCQHTALAWLIASIVPEEEIMPGSADMEDLLEGLSHGEDCMLGWLQLPPEPWLKTCLGRVAGDAPFELVMGALMKLKACPGARRFLKHERPLDRRFAEFILYAEPDCVSGALLHEVLDASFPDSDFNWVRTCLEDAGKAVQTGSEVPRFRSALHLDRWHRKNPVLLGRTGFHEPVDRGVFPKIPKPGNRYIIPLRSWAELDRESHVMGHPKLLWYDLRDYDDSETGIYILTKPERAVFAICRRTGKHWNLFYFFRPFLREPSPESRKFVLDWLRR